MMDKRESFLRLIEENKKQIVKICNYYSSLYSQISAEDLFQDILMALWCSFPKFVKHHDCKISTYVYRVAHNVSISQCRKIKDKTVSLNEGDVLIERDTPQELSILYDLIGKLSQEEQVLVYLYLDEKSHNEIAEILGISVTNVGTKIQRVKKKLKLLNKKNNDE